MESECFKYYTVKDLNICGIALTESIVVLKARRRDGTVVPSYMENDSERVEFAVLRHHCREFCGFIERVEPKLVSYEVYTGEGLFIVEFAVLFAWQTRQLYLVPNPEWQFLKVVDANCVGQ